MLARANRSILTRTRNLTRSKLSVSLWIPKPGSLFLSKRSQSSSAAATALSSNQNDDTQHEQLSKIALISTASLLPNHSKTHFQKVFNETLEPVRQISYLKDTSDLAYIIDQLDAMAERKWPIPSTLLDRFVNGCTNVYEWKFCKYYIYSFRHSPCGEYLRPWSVLNWLEKGLTLEKEAWGQDNLKDILEILSNKPQYGMFLHQVGNDYLLENLASRLNFPGKGQNENLNIPLAEQAHPEQILSVISILYKSESFDKFSTACLSAKLFLNLENFQELDFFNGDIDNLKNIGGIFQSLGYNLEIASFIEVGEKILKIVESRLLEENNFRKMYMKPFSPQRHLPVFLNEPEIGESEQEFASANLKKLIENECQADFEKMLLEPSTAERIAKETEKNLKLGKTWSSIKSHLSQREAKIVNDRVSRLYNEKVSSKINVEARVQEISKEGLWLKATDEEKATHGRAEGTIPDSKILFEEYADDSKKLEQMSAFGIHDIDLEQKLDAEIRVFNTTDGNVDLFLPHEFSDSPIEFHKWNQSLRTVAVAKAHIAFRTKKEWLKSVPMDDVKEGIYDLEFATVGSKKK